MGDWKRSTRECGLDGLGADMRRAIEAHIERYGLGHILSNHLMCIETISEKTNKPPFARRNEEVAVAAIITPGWLLWAIHGASAVVTVMSAQLSDVVMQDYAATKLAAMVPDTGIEVSGAFTDVAERGAAFIGLGDEPAAAEFKQVALEAAQTAKRQPR